MAVGCKKEEVKTTSATQDTLNSELLNIPKIKTVTEWIQEIDAQGNLKNSDTLIGFATYNYDKLGRLTSMTGNLRTEDVYVITYNSSNLITMLEDGNTNTLSLNSNGYVYLKSGKYKNESYYDNYGFEKYMNSAITVVDNGNLIEYKDSSQTVKYEYYKELNTIGNFNKGISFFGKDSKNLCKSRTSIYPQRSETYIQRYNYKFDTENRVIESVETSIDNTKSSYWRITMKYTYTN